jgi:hypothetical protein
MPDAPLYCLVPRKSPNTAHNAYCTSFWGVYGSERLVSYLRGPCGSASRTCKCSLLRPRTCVPARSARGLTGGCGCAGSSAMNIFWQNNIWQAAWRGDAGEVERLLGHNPTLLKRKDYGPFSFEGKTPLMVASMKGHVEVVRLLIDKGAAIDEHTSGTTALWYACHHGRLPVVRLLVERGADPAGRSTPLIAASAEGHVEVVRVLLSYPRAQATINHRGSRGQTALWRTCYGGHPAVVSALLEGGADPTIASNNGTTPMAIAKAQQDPPLAHVSAEGRLNCVAALEVSLGLVLLPLAPAVQNRSAEAWGVVFGHAGRRRRGFTSCGRPGRWPTSRGAAR